jgi:hypothetical protein
MVTSNRGNIFPMLPIALDASVPSILHDGQNVHVTNQLPLPGRPNLLQIPKQQFHISGIPID